MTKWNFTEKTTLQELRKYMIKKHDTIKPIKKISNSMKYRSSNYTRLKERINAKFKKTLNIKKYTRIIRFKIINWHSFPHWRFWIKYISMDINTSSSN